MASTKIKTDNVWTEYNGKKFAAEYAEYSKRASKDVDGNDIVDTYATKDPMVGATSQEAGEAGLVPAPAVADKDKFLKGDGTWDEPPRVSLDDYYYDVYGNGLSATRHNTSLAGSATLLGTSGNVNSADLSAQFSLSWGGSVINMINVNTTSPNGSYWAFGSGSNKGARYMLPPPSSGSVKYAVNKADGGIYWDTIPTATASGTGATGNDGLMTAADKAKMDSLVEVTEADIDAMFMKVTIGDREYNVVRIGNQEWMAENLDYAFDYNGEHLPIGVDTIPTTPAAWYYSNNKALYGIDGTYKCGLLYNWYAAKYLSDNSATLLPAGWRVPSSADIATLTTTAGGTALAGTALKALDNSVTNNWPSGLNGEDLYGFAGLPSGSVIDLSFSDIGTIGRMWSNSSYDTNAAYGVGFHKNASDFTQGTFSKTFGLSIRLVKDIT